MHTIKRFVASAAVILFTFLSSICADRLSLTDGGYARVVRLQQYPLSSFTLSGWVNVTHFAEGITPFLTYLSQDVNSQISFFLRPEGIGILWGGPSGSEKGLYNMEIDRKPRFYSPTEELKREKREAIDYSAGLGDIENILTKRSMKTEDNWPPSNFVDVGTMGVYDLMLSGSDHEPTVADEREARSKAPVYSQWTNVPYELHMEESGGEGEYSKKEPRIITQPSGSDDFVYFNWNVPTNQRNIPLGNNNWSPVWESEKQIPDISHENLPQNIEPKISQKPTKIIATPTRPQKVWAESSQNTAVDPSSDWQPPITNINFFDYSPVETKLLPTKFERPIWPLRPQQRKPVVPSPTTENPNAILKESSITTQTIPSTVHTIRPRIKSSITKSEPLNTIPNVIKAIPTNTISNVLNSEESNVVQKVVKTPANIIKLQGIQIQGTPSSISTNSYFFTTSSPKEPPTTESSTSATRSTSSTAKILKASLGKSPNLRRNVIPTLYRYTNKTKSTQITSKQSTIKEILAHQESKQSRTRVPLWKLITKPQISTEEKLGSRNEVKENKYDTSSAPVYKSIPVFTHINDSTTTEPPLVKTYKYLIPEPTLPPINSKDKEDSGSLGSSRRNLYRSRPVQIPSIKRRPSVVTVRSSSTVTTTNPTTTTRRIPYKPTPITHKVPNYQGSKIETLKPKTSLWQRKETTNHNEVKQITPKLNLSKYDYTRANEFEKAMQDPKLVKEGNTAVVYAVPITNEKEFYEMYKKYQKESVEPSQSSVNLHELYNKMRTGGMNSKQKTKEEEEEVNENIIKYPEISMYKKEPLYPINEPTEIAHPNIGKITPPTKILIENITEVPLRSDIPVQDYDDEIVQSNETQTSPNINQVEDYKAEESDQSQNTYAAYDDQMSDFLNNHFYDYYNAEDSENTNAAPVYDSNDNESSDTLEVQSDDYYLPMIDKNKEDLADLYRPKSIATLNPPEISPSYYQEPLKISHEQLPPQYQKQEKELGEKNANFKEPILEYYNPGGIDRVMMLPKKETENNKEQTTEPQYNSNELDFISESLIPKPIHRAGTDELENWYLNQKLLEEIKGDMQTSEAQNIYSKTDEFAYMPESTFTAPLINTIQGDHILTPISTAQDVNGLSSDKLPLDIHFEKISYTFKENAWYHIAFTWNSKTRVASIFINGEQVGTIDNVLETDEQLDEGGLFLLGKALLPDLSDFDESSQFEGEMSDVNLYAAELAPHSVDALFQCKYDPQYPQPIEWDTTELKLYDSASMTLSPPLCGLVT